MSIDSYVEELKQLLEKRGTPVQEWEQKLIKRLENADNDKNYIIRCPPDINKFPVSENHTETKWEGIQVILGEPDPDLPREHYLFFCKSIKELKRHLAASKRYYERRFRDCERQIARFESGELPI